ncbi:MAG: CBM20 domain-containing protein [Bradymonadia bacterium]
MSRNSLSHLLILTWAMLMGGCASEPAAEQAAGAEPQPTSSPFTGKTDGAEASRAVELPRPGAAPWGGDDPGLWTPEAIIANAVSEALVTAWKQPGIVDAVVSVPVGVWPSEFSPFGDGQTNAAATLGSWSHPRPPVLAVLYLLDDGTQSVQITLDRALPVGDSLSVEYMLEGEPVDSGPLLATKTDAGDLQVWWSPPAALGWADRRMETVAWVRPTGWGDAFPLSFKVPVHDAQDLAASAPQRSAFADGRALPDPEAIAAGDAALNPFERLKAHTFGTGYNTDPYPAEVIHGSHPHRQPGQTAVGGGWTWLAQPPVAPLKHIYICFEPRQPGLEALAGVPSGAGWHKIGDPAESLVNSLESAPILTGWGMNTPQSPLSGGAAYGLGDVSAYRLLWPGEAFVTATSPDNRGIYHWYAVHHDVPVCTEIWVHPCAPGPSLDLRCADEDVPELPQPGMPEPEMPAPETPEPETPEAPQPGAQMSLSFTVHGGVTQWGQSVAVVGNTPALGSWDPTKAFALSVTDYPTWSGTVDISEGELAPGQVVEFKFIKVGNGTVEWSPGANHTLTVGAEGAAYESGWAP